MRKIIDIIITSVMVVVIIFAALIAGGRLIGLQPYTVISGSMSPKYPVGSMIYVKKTTAAELKVNDPITYTLESGTVVTHRIIEILPDEDNPTVVRYRVKGDANDDADGEPVHIKNVIGKPVFCIPLIGYVAYFIQRPPGNYMLIMLFIGLVMLSFIPNIYDLLMKKTASEQPAVSEMIEDGNISDADADNKADAEVLTEQNESGDS